MLAVIRSACFYSKVIQIYLEPILGGQTGIPKISFLVSPFLQATVIEHLPIIPDNKRYDSVPKAFFEQDQSPYASISILKRMNRLKPIVEVQQVIEGGCFQLSIV